MYVTNVTNLVMYRNYIEKRKRTYLPSHKLFAVFIFVLQTGIEMRTIKGNCCHIPSRFSLKTFLSAEPLAFATGQIFVWRAEIGKGWVLHGFHIK